MLKMLYKLITAGEVSIFLGCDVGPHPPLSLSSGTRLNNFPFPPPSFSVRQLKDLSDKEEQAVAQDTQSAGSKSRKAKSKPKNA